MKIEAGKYYRSRKGAIYGPLVYVGDRHNQHFECPDTGVLWFREGYHAWNGSPSNYDLLSEVYVSDTPPADAPAAPPSDDTVITLNFSQMARDGSNWTAGSIGFWIGDEMRMAHYDVRIGGVEDKAWPSDVPNPWRDNRGLPAPAPEAKTLRDEAANAALTGLLAKAVDDGSMGAGDWASDAYFFADAMMEARKK